jgi:hypothetical protein
MVMSKKTKRPKKKTALIISRSGKQFWTTQAQFWQWVRGNVAIKTGDNPLRGVFAREHEESFVVISNTVLNTAYPNHLHESLTSRRLGLSK